MSRVSTVASLLLVMLVGCSAPQSGGVPVAKPAPSPQPSPVATYPPVAAPQAQPAPREVVASARPLSPLPPPGQMPPGSGMREIQDHGALIAGVYPDILQFGYLDPVSNQFQGFDPDLVREIARAIFGDPSRVEFKSLTSAQRIPSLLSPEQRAALINNTDLMQRLGISRDDVAAAPAVDVVAASMTINATRKEAIDFSEVYYDAGQRVLIYRTSPYQGIQDLSGKPVCSVKGSTSEKNATQANPNIVLESQPYYADCLRDLKERKVSAVTTDDVILASLAAQDPNLTLVGPKFTDEPYGVGVQKGRPQLLAFVNGVIAQMKQDGRWKQLYDTWLGRFAPAPQPPEGVYSG
jgi:polar amino acid transport system substrate-binding protein